ncbi:glycoside hydrolase family 16 protein [Thermothelomyces thermophilus ATCC 42464]|uniref:Glycoside hydrolase family 16 protein n=1 Tax=Thermothelomyces thermophilus (strain ATCC 42464 / BCRC 31852 / DSM 1799) TaxID=573729 RepID=G2Q1F8_THET4|nr:glycoside hydrolase family 16 protein [Thermothelomyces thermophilus ATCC 42464]AEO54148.1 glycoside hydrolase family 16 protein [Thermothelomyces thermophilus ATCC 42464]
MVRLGSSLAGFALAASTARAGSYTLVDTFDASNFFDEFDFFTEPDPTHGFVQYVDGDTANREGLAGFASGGVYLGVDYSSTTTTTTTGRASVRLTSRKAYTRGLFVADIAHMPAGAAGSSSCGLWPAFWMFGPDWPNSGEIDVVEGVNSQTSNSVSLHTGAGCTVSNPGASPGTKLVSADCQGGEGCTQDTSAPDNYGAGFNAAGGGIYAVEWTDAAIKVWFLPRDSPIASQLSSSFSSSSSSSFPSGGNNNNTNIKDNKSLDPSAFGTPLAVFAGGAECPIGDHFANHHLVFDTTFCGDWAGRVWAADGACAALADTCEDYVAAHPEAFSEAYWLLGSIRVYQLEADAGAGTGTGGASAGGGDDGQGEGGGQGQRRGLRPKMARRWQA